MSQKLRISGHKLYNVFQVIKKKSPLAVFVLKFPYIMYRTGEYKYLKNYMSHLENLSARRLTLSQFHNEDRLMGGTTIQDFIILVP